MKRHRMHPRILIPAAVLVLLALAIGAQRLDDYRGAAMPAPETLQKSLERIRGSEYPRIQEVVGAAALENSAFQVYAYLRDRSGNVFVDDSITLVKLDTEVWIMRLRGADQEAERWGLVTRQ
ncbi:MAG: hypothetical protein GX580_05635 [Candidatus Hydrogenedens sp.]|nr:hypothetical protein [Candidatus Hydrogenedens sp.]